jgi:uncharacterized protein (DUF3084 family)
MLASGLVRVVRGEFDDSLDFPPDLPLRVDSRILELPARTLRTQLEAAYRALDTLDVDRCRMRTELQAVKAEAARTLDEAHRRADAAGARANDAEARANEAEARADEALSKAALDIGRLSSERDALLAQIRDIYASNSWRITQPLRGALRALHWIHGQLTLPALRLH